MQPVASSNGRATEQMITIVEAVKVSLMSFVSLLWPRSPPAGSYLSLFDTYSHKHNGTHPDLYLYALALTPVPPL